MTDKKLGYALGAMLAEVRELIDDVDDEDKPAVKYLRVVEQALIAAKDSVK